MKTKLIMLDTPIIVSDERIQYKNTCLDTNSNETFTCMNNKAYGIYDEDSWVRLHKNCKKIIAGIEGLPSINWNGLEEEFGWVDVDLYLDELLKEDENLFSMVDPLSYTVGFKKAQSLNEKKFSLEDMMDAFYAKEDVDKREEHIFFDDFIQSLQQPKVFDIAVEMECAYGDECPSEGSYLKQHLCKVQPKITNNSIKILRK